MPQPETDPESDDRNRTYFLTVRLRQHEKDTLDQVRGSWPLSTYAREALLAAVENGLRGPDEKDFR